MEGAAVEVAVAGAVVIALSLVGSQVLFRAETERGTLAGERATEQPAENRLLPGDPLPPEPQEGRATPARQTQGTPGLTHSGGTPAAPVAIPASFRSPELSPAQAEADRDDDDDSDDDQPSAVSPEMVARARAAVRQVLVGGVTDVEQDGGTSYEVEFELSGDDVEVVLDRAFNVMAEADEDDRAPTAAEVEQARAAARALAQLGDVDKVEREDDGRGFEVEFLRPDGTVLNVRLNASLDLVSGEVESD